MLEVVEKIVVIDPKYSYHQETHGKTQQFGQQLDNGPIEVLGAELLAKIGQAQVKNHDGDDDSHDPIRKRLDAVGGLMRFGFVFLVKHTSGFFNKIGIFCSDVMLLLTPRYAPRYS